MNERIAQHALARHFNYFQQTIVPNAFMCGGEMDLAVVTRAGYLVEVEIKLTLADWIADRSKAKWDKVAERAKVSRFYYAVPTALVGRNPMWVPVECGLIEIQWAPKQQRAYCIERIQAIRNKSAPKLTDQEWMHLLGKTYHRFWQRELRAAA